MKISSEATLELLLELVEDLQDAAIDYGVALGVEALSEAQTPEDVITNDLLSDRYDEASSKLLRALANTFKKSSK